MHPTGSWAIKLSVPRGYLQFDAVEGGYVFTSLYSLHLSQLLYRYFSSGIKRFEGYTLQDPVRITIKTYVEENIGICITR